MMNRKRWESIVTVLIVAFTLNGAYAQEQHPAKKAKDSNQSIAPLTASPVIGNGTPGQITKWTGVSGTSTYSIGDSIITEDKFGKVGIGTTTPTSLLTVAGMIETTMGGYKFPDGTLQTTAGIAFVTHDASLAGLGTAGSPLGISFGGVQTVHLANGAVTAPKIANGTVVRSLNNLFDNVAIVGGSNITVTPSGNTLTIAAPNTLTAVARDATLTGNGTSATPLGIANGGVGTTQLANQSVTTAKLATQSIDTAQLADGSVNTAKLADGAVTLSKIAVNQVVTSVNNLKEGVTLAAGSNISITPSGNTLTFSAAASEGPTAYHAYESHTDELKNPGYDVISKELPVGSYLLLFKMGYYSLDGDSQQLTCTMSTGGLAGHDFIFVQEKATGFFILQNVATLAAPTTVTVHCDGFKIFPYGQVVLTAIRVGSIQ